MMLKKLPKFLIYSRVLVAALILLISIHPIANYKLAITGLIVYALLSDFFDGYIARLTQSSTITLRRLDSTIDQVFWVAVMIGTYILSPQFYLDHWLYILIILLLESATYVISYIRFRKEVATHAIASKLWVLSLMITFVDVIWTGNSNAIFFACFIIGIISRLEIISILLLLKQWTSDVPSVYHAAQLRKGKDIKRNKIFNG